MLLRTCSSASSRAWLAASARASAHGARNRSSVRVSRASSLQNLNVTRRNSIMFAVPSSARSRCGGCSCNRGRSGWCPSRWPCRRRNDRAKNTEMPTKVGASPAFLFAIRAALARSRLQFANDPRSQHSQSSPWRGARCMRASARVAREASICRSIAPSTIRVRRVKKREGMRSARDVAAVRDCAQIRVAKPSLDRNDARKYHNLYDVKIKEWPKNLHALTLRVVPIEQVDGLQCLALSGSATTVDNAASAAGTMPTRLQKLQLVERGRWLCAGRNCPAAAG